MFETLFVIGVAVVFFLALRARELFCLSVREGKLLLVRGRIPGGLFSALQDALANLPVRRGSVKAVRHEGGCSIRVSGDIDEFRAQRLRNIFNTYPASQLRAAPIATQRTVGQLLGIAWLAWLLDRRA